MPYGMSTARCDHHSINPVCASREQEGQLLGITAAYTTDSLLAR
jgi:hypothetical protein